MVYICTCKTNVIYGLVVYCACLQAMTFPFLHALSVKCSSTLNLKKKHIPETQITVPKKTNNLNSNDSKHFDQNSRQECRVLIITSKDHWHIIWFGLKGAVFLIISCWEWCMLKEYKRNKMLNQRKNNKTTGNTNKRRQYIITK